MAEKNAENLDAKAQIDFKCIQEGCNGIVKFNLIDVVKDRFQVPCPKCHNPYSFDKQLRDKLMRMRNLIIAIRQAEDIISDCNVAVTVPGGEVKVPYALLLTRLNTMITLNLGDKKVDFHLWVEPASPDTFR